MDALENEDLEEYADKLQKIMETLPDDQSRMWVIAANDVIVKLLSMGKKLPLLKRTGNPDISEVPFSSYLVEDRICLYQLISSALKEHS